MSAKIAATYSHQVDDNTIVQLPISIMDVDEMWIWMMVDAGFEQWHFAIPWSDIVADYFPQRVKELQEMEPPKPGELVELPKLEETT